MLSLCAQHHAIIVEFLISAPASGEYAVNPDSYITFLPSASYLRLPRILPETLADDVIDANSDTIYVRN